MRTKKGVLLLEVAFVVLLVSIISVFLFRGYSLFMKVGRKSLDYLGLTLLAEEVLWDLQMQEATSDALTPDDLVTEGTLSESSSRWSLALGSTEYGGLQKGVVRLQYDDKKKPALDTILYLRVEEGE